MARCWSRLTGGQYNAQALLWYNNGQLKDNCSTTQMPKAHSVPRWRGNKRGWLTHAKHFLNLFTLAATYVVFNTTRAHPMSESSLNQILGPNAINNILNLSNGRYYLRVTKDSIVADLPFFGRSYSAPMNTDNTGTRFTSIFDFEKEKELDNYYRTKRCSGQAEAYYQSFRVRLCYIEC